MIKKTKNHVKIGDKVQIISGNQKGKVGTINAIFKKNSLVYIENVPPRLKKLKQSKEVDKKEIRLEIPIHISNVMIWDTEANQPSRIGYKTIENKKVRYFKKSGNFM
jgi:large subunit ribosomal protein L24